MTALHWAALGSKEAVELLLARNAPINIKNTQGVTPVHIAAQRNTEILQLLLEHEGDITVRDKTGKTPLHHAASSECEGNLGAVDVLIVKGADVNAVDDIGWRPLDWAIYGRPNLRAMRSLLKNGADPNGDALYLAAAWGDGEVVRLLLDYHAAVDGVKDDGTPLHVAARAGNLRAAMVLVDQRAQINARTKDGQTPLALATTFRRTRVAEFLRQMGGVQ